jgi:MFS superfamily sulfate permease-like transporter
LKVLFVDYELNYAIIEMIGEWNDAVENDIMQLKRSVIDLMIADHISKFILITENVLNFHSSDREYYEEWIEDIKDDGGWVVSINMPDQTQYDFHKSKIDRYITFMEEPNWRTYKPDLFFQVVDNRILRLLD